MSGVIRVERGGTPTPEEIAAIVLALTQLRATTATGQQPAWQRAAVLEGVGTPACASVADLAAAR